jgi:hypothetical protein
MCLPSLIDYVMHLVLPFIIFIRMHLASHLGSLDAPREGWVVEAKPEDGVWWNYPEEGSTQRVSSDNYWLVLDPRQAPEHSKPPTLQKQLSIYIYVIYVLLH